MMQTLTGMILSIYLMAIGCACQALEKTMQPNDKYGFEKVVKDAGLGNANAEFTLGNMYATGKDVPQNYGEAAKWYRKAAEKGNADAQQNLGIFYELGRGVPQDYIQAYMWFNLSGAQGNTASISFRDKLAESMNAEQINEAQKLTREWKPRL